VLRRKTMSDYVQKLVDAVRAEQIRKLKEDGWTPPPVKPEPEFKPGDYVEVSSTGVNWFLTRYRGKNECGEYLDEKGIWYKHCRHAPTWIKWEDGPAPKDCKGKGNVWKGGDGRLHIDMYDGRWAWMPE